MQDTLNIDSKEKTSDLLLNDIIENQIVVLLIESIYIYLTQNKLIHFVDFFLYLELEILNKIAQQT